MYKVCIIDLMNTKLTILKETFMLIGYSLGQDFDAHCLLSVPEPLQSGPP